MDHDPHALDPYERALAGQRRRFALGARLGVLAGLFALAGVGVVLALAAGGDSEGPPGPDRGGDATLVEPAGPYDGLESLGLPVVVDPEVGLTDGQTVRVTATGFTPNTQLVMVQCHGEYDHSGGAAACDAGNYQLAGSDEQGAVDTSFVARRHITNDHGIHDCAESTVDRGCSLAIANVADYDESGFARTFFDAAIAGVPAPVIAVSPTGGLSDGDPITVSGTDFVPGETARITQCVLNRVGIPGCFGSNPTTEVLVDVDGTFTVTVAATRVVSEGVDDVDCVRDPYGCRVLAAGQRVPNPVEILFAGDERPPSDPTFTVTPSADLADGDPVALVLSDLRGADGPYVVEQCVDVAGATVCVELAEGTAVDGTLSTSVAVQRVIDIVDGTTRDCAQPGRRCYLRISTEFQDVERLPLDFREEG